MKLFQSVQRSGADFHLSRKLSLIAAASLLALSICSPVCGQFAKPVVSCQSLAKVELPDATITMAQEVGPGQYTLPARNAAPGAPSPSASAGATPNSAPPPAPRTTQRRMGGPFDPPADGKNHAAFCRVAATLAPSADSDIKVEIWLPVSTWNGKLAGIANMGWAGAIVYDGLLYGVEKGYAAVSTDTGHTNQQDVGAFGLDHPDKRIDYGYRAVHEMTLKAKALMKAYYGVGPQHSYWDGCSLGGQQGLTEVQRFPQDYDGVIIGAPAAPIDNLNAMQIMPGILISQDPARAVPMSKVNMLHQAIVKKCDELDGVKDGILENPEACHLDPQELLCKKGGAPDCLAAPQAYLMRQIYNGYLNPRTGKTIYAPSALGSEILFGPVLNSGKPLPLALGLFQNFIFQDADWDWKNFDPERDLAFADKVLATVNLTKNSNLKPFFDRGGKLLMYHGWEDWLGPRQTFNYYESVLKTVGPQAGRSMRVFGIPGMGHCAGGEGCDAFDKLELIDKWMETGVAPERFVSSKLDEEGKVIRTHPVCAECACPDYVNILYL